MSIKADSWIRRMAEAHGMIEPFSPNQVSLRHEFPTVCLHMVMICGSLTSSRSSLLRRE